MSLRVHTMAAGFAVVHLIEGPDGLILVDAGSPGQEQRILERVASIDGAGLRLIYITHAHFDHYGSAAALRRATGAPIAVHGADARALSEGETRLGSVRSWGRVGKAVLPAAQRLWPLESTRPDVEVDEGHSLAAYGIDAEIVHTPGHTPGSSTLVLGDGSAFVGDLLSHRFGIRTQRFYADDWSALQRSYARLHGLRPSRLFLGHGRRVPEGDILDRILGPRSG